MKPRRPWYFVIQPQQSKTPKHPKFNAFWGPKQVRCYLCPEPRRPRELQSHTSFLPLSSKTRFQLPSLHSLSPCSHISPGIYRLIPFAQRPICGSETFFMRIFFFNAIFPLMVPCQAASHTNYKLFVYMWECSHHGKRPRFPCPVLNLEGQKRCTEALKDPYPG